MTIRIKIPKNLFILNMNILHEFFWFEILFFVIVFRTINATFTDNFRSFLRGRYGNEVESELTRLDMGGGGSFGGGLSHVYGAQTR